MSFGDSEWFNELSNQNSKFLGFSYSRTRIFDEMLDAQQLVPKLEELIKLTGHEKFIWSFLEGFFLGSIGQHLFEFHLVESWELARVPFSRVKDSLQSLKFPIASSIFLKSVFAKAL